MMSVTFDLGPSSFLLLAWLTSGFKIPQEKNKKLAISSLRNQNIGKEIFTYVVFSFSQERLSPQKELPRKYLRTLQYRLCVTSSRWLKTLERWTAKAWLVSFNAASSMNGVSCPSWVVCWSRGGRKHVSYGLRLRITSKTAALDQHGRFLMSAELLIWIYKVAKLTNCLARIM